MTTLPFQGRNTLLYMTAADYALPRRTPSPPPDYNPCALAAKAGDLHLLQELRRRGHAWNTEMLQVSRSSYSHSHARTHSLTHSLTHCMCVRRIQCAAWAGHLHVLRWAWENGCPWSWEVCEVAASRGCRPEIVDWVRAHRETRERERETDSARQPEIDGESGEPVAAAKVFCHE